ncbi:putative O-glycosylation ligase, exosortase A system-associated [Bowmanella sp. JS7-9]|uniref:O-glycosylation ligase, exosortase A system-associated n=1 Tax=Pseudobowmanella zhangzhouensis TaxID=1537679 RepID=A0ABW1XHU5_9ALTE|nr:putative O-glycosylation ligase, exosortase A system-associated [Bowmanella sp. JS7-9]
MRDLILVAFLFIAIYYSFKKPFIGVAAWVWIALMAPASWAFGFSQSFRLNLTIVLVTALSYVFVFKGKAFKFTRIHFWVFLFLLWTLISTATNLNVDPDWVWDYWFNFLKILMLFLFVTLVVTRRIHVDTVIWAIVLSISAYAGMEALKFLLSAGSHRITGRAGIIADRNDLAVAINMSIPLIVYLLQVSKHKWVKRGLSILLILNILSIVGTYSRAGFIGLMILGTALWWNSKHRVSILLVAVVSIPLLYGAAPDSWKERQSTVSTAAEEDLSFIGRLWAWKISTMIAVDHPFFGGGFAAVRDPILWAHYGARTPHYPPIYTRPIPDTIIPKAAHNIFMQVLGDHGFGGLFVFCMILFSAWRVNLITRKKAREHNQDWLVKLTTMLNLSFLAYAINGCNVSLAYFDEFYALAGLVAVLFANQLWKESTDKSAKQTTPGHDHHVTRSF